MNMKTQKNTFDSTFLLFVFIIVVFTIELFILKNTPFFWDASSKSVRASWFYDTNFIQFVIPTELNSGHPPLWTILLSVWWKIFGKTLLASRFLMLIINVLVGIQLVYLLKNNFPYKNVFFYLSFILLEPTLIAQTTIMNNDMLLLLFTLIAFNIIAYSKQRQQILFTIVLTGILFSNLRGILIFFGIIIINIIYYRKGLTKTKINIFAYFISFSLLMFFFVYQYNILGWIVKTPSPNWNEQRELATIPNVIKNSIAIVRNFLDYGRIVLIIVTIMLLYKYFKEHMDDRIKKVLIAIFVFSVGMSGFFIFFTNPIGHRYYMFSYILIVLLFLLLIDLTFVKFKKSYLFGIVLLGFVTGHLWIYPTTIAQGWDSSLAYLRYFKLRNSMESFIQIKGLDKKEIGTNLPLNKKKYTDLISDEQFEKYAIQNVEFNKYIILSNIENHTSDEDIYEISTFWIPVKDYRQMGVFVTLYRNPRK